MLALSDDDAGDQVEFVQIGDGLLYLGGGATEAREDVRQRAGRSKFDGAADLTGIAEGDENVELRFGKHSLTVGRLANARVEPQGLT